MDSRNAISQGLVQLFLSMLPITSIVGNKIFLDKAGGDDDIPYIRVKHIYGGYTHRTQRLDFNQTWMIVAVSWSQVQASNLSGLIQAELIKVPNPLNYPDGWKTDGMNFFRGNIANVSSVQGRDLWETGGYYELKGTK